MRVLVCGGRAYSNEAKVFETLNIVHADRAITCIIHGDAGYIDEDDTVFGADKLAGVWADRHWGVTTEVYPAQWDKYGRRAGYLRNREMLVVGKPDLVVAFPGKAGTAMMIRLAKEADISVIEVLPPERVSA